MSSNGKDDWEVVKDITYVVVEEIKGKSTAFDDTLAKTLGVSGEYMDWLGRNGHATLFEKVSEILDKWKDQKNGARGIRYDLIRALETKQKASSCQLLILRLKEGGPQGALSSNASPPHSYQASQSYPNINAQGNVTIQTGGGNIDSRNHGVGYVSGSGNRISVGSQDQFNINKKTAGIMADGNAKISENAINAGAVMGDVGTFSGTISELSLIQNSGLGSKNKKTKDELFVLMKDFKIDSMYEKFHENGVTTEVIWVLDDEILTDILKLNALEKIKYKTAKDKALQNHN